MSGDSPRLVLSPQKLLDLLCTTAKGVPSFKQVMSGIQVRASKAISHLALFCFSTLCDWLAKLAALF